MNATTDPDQVKNTDLNGTSQTLFSTPVEEQNSKIISNSSNFSDGRDDQNIVARRHNVTHLGSKPKSLITRTLSVDAGEKILLEQTINDNNALREKIEKLEELLENHQNEYNVNITNHKTGFFTSKIRSLLGRNNNFDRLEEDKDDNDTISLKNFSRGEITKLHPIDVNQGIHDENTLMDEDESVNELTTDDSFSAKDETFFAKMKDRATWLIGLLVLQSCSSFILRQNEDLLESHIVIVRFLTMVVGAGGNAGNQASVQVIRGLATNELNSSTRKSFLWQEAKMALYLSVVIACAGLGRAVIFQTPFPESVAISVALYFIVITAITMGVALPLGMQHIGIDPAHSATTVAVVMDILGVLITVQSCSLILGRFFGMPLKLPDEVEEDLDIICRIWCNETGICNI